MLLYGPVRLLTRSLVVDRGGRLAKKRIVGVAVVGVGVGVLEVYGRRKIDRTAGRVLGVGGDLIG